MRIQLPALVACALSMLLACGPDGDGAFAIDEVEYPEAVVSDGARGTLTIHWAGNPTFPSKRVIAQPRMGAPIARA